MDEFAQACGNEETRMITLPQLITTDTDMTAGLTSGKTTGSAKDFLALAGALGADGAQGKTPASRWPVAGQSVKLADWQANATDGTLTVDASASASAR